MENVWIKVLNQSIGVSIVILAVLLVRGIIMRKVPKKYVFFLWVIVGLRLLIPVGITTSIDWFQKVPDKVEQSTEKSVENKSPTQKEVKLESAEITGGKITNAESQNSQSVSANSSQTVKSKESQKQNVEKVLSQVKQRIGSEKVIHVTAYLWIGGMVLFGMWNLLTCVQMRKRLRQAVLYKDNIYECDKIGSPFVMGLVRPRIYIPFRLREEELSYILKHEQYHIKRKDYLTKLVACILLGIYWFHPLVWMAYFFMVRDMEMSCDEYVVQTMGDEIKKEYSTSLLAFATNTRRMSMGMLAFGESGTRKRVKHILKSKKTAKWVGVVGVVLVLVTGIFCFVTSNIGEPIKNVAKGAEKETEKEEKAEKQTEKTKQEDNRPELYVSKENPKCFVYKGKTIKVKKAECISIEKVEYINDEEIAVWCKTDSDVLYLFCYLIEYKDLIYEAKGYDFIWEKDDIETMLYTVGPEQTGGDYAVYNSSDQEIYSSKNPISKIEFLNDDTVLVTEMEKDQEGKEREVQKEIEPGIFYTVKADVTGDGIEDEIKINISKEVIEPYTKYEQNVVKVISGATGKVVYTMGNMRDINLVHMGANSLYLYHGEDKEYLLIWSPVMYQGNANYKYKIFTVNESGKKDVLEKDEFSFYTGDMNKAKIQKYKDFIEKVNNRLKNSDVLISTLDGILVTYNDSTDHRLLFDSSSDLDTMNTMNGGY